MSIIAINSGLNALVTLKELFSSNSNKEEQKRNMEIVLRQYNAEVLYNTKMLDTINFNSRLNDDRLGALRSIAPLLKNEYGKTIVASLGFYGKSLDSIEEQAKLIDEDTLSDGGLSLKVKIIFTVNRIEVLQNLARMPNERYTKKINVSVRLKNIRNYTKDICNAFSKSFENIVNQILV